MGRDDPYGVTRKAVFDLEFVWKAGWAVASGYLLVLCQISEKFSPLVWVALVPLLFVLRRADTKQALWYGFLWGVVYFGLANLAVTLKGSVVVTHSEHFTTFASTGGSAHVISGWLLAFLCAFGFSLTTLFISTLSRRALFNPILIASVWAAFELVRIKLGVAFGLLADAHHSPFLLNFANFAGLIAVSFLIALANSAWVSLYEWVREKFTPAYRFASLPDFPHILIPNSQIRYQILALVPEVRGPPGAAI